jgi:hypothetical protein
MKGTNSPQGGKLTNERVRTPCPLLDGVTTRLLALFCFDCCRWPLDPLVTNERRRTPCPLRGGANCRPLAFFSSISLGLLTPSSTSGPDRLSSGVAHRRRRHLAAASPVCGARVRIGVPRNDAVSVRRSQTRARKKGRTKDRVASRGGAHNTNTRIKQQQQPEQPSVCHPSVKQASRSQITMVHPKT